ncbi:hypothetical protein CFC21_034617 [Triticum aestivum]|uniref:Peroxidase n=3 Tax=Triticum TaxID=4564 RepID=A0A9R0RFC2_TRITD|nr:peroxidase 2-like [Triticum dicoccoides]KAF7021721.1 hypothetical protein CFC21_034617 [Triticum aestivum]VAH58833.1 unnamed protein product [Triticum turgidum subsp. durum]
MAGGRVNLAVALLLALHGLLPPSAHAALQDGFYGASTNCTVDVEAVVRGVVERHVSRLGDGGSGAGLIRLHFHDCFVKGCDGSVLIDPSPVNPDPEKASPANGGLRGIDVVEEAKRQLEALCPGTVSCADILAFAARDAANVLSSGAISYDVPSGRRDGLTSDAADASQSLPPPFAQLGDLVRAFASKGFGIDELVALSGAHSIGRAHCSSFGDRIHPAVHETMDPSYGADMRSRCPEDAGAGEWVAQDQATPGDLDGRYFENVLAGRVPFSSDRALIDDGETRRMVEDNSGDQGEWAARFAAAMRKMSELAGTGEGEIREFCHVTNRG